jgi:hypothetical protein
MSNETEVRAGPLSRRLLLRSTVAAAGAVATVAAYPKPSSAVIKISQTAVAYQDHPEGDKRCGKCLQFQQPSSCKIVDGEISPQGFCRIFIPLRQASRPIPTAPAFG